jgi:hypothetical protein
MKHETKIKRLELVLEVLSEEEGKTLALNNWLELVNQRLCENIRFRNTKELACVFHCISRRKKYDMVQQSKFEGIFDGEGSTCYMKFNLYTFRRNND